ncbi:hypothetical protein L9F63_024385, partial [Diploptera punctata]
RRVPAAMPTPCKQRSASSPRGLSSTMQSGYRKPKTSSRSDPHPASLRPLTAETRRLPQENHNEHQSTDPSGGNTTKLDTTVVLENMNNQTPAISSHGQRGHKKETTLFVLYAPDSTRASRSPRVSSRPTAPPLYSR